MSSSSTWAARRHHHEPPAGRQDAARLGEEPRDAGHQLQQPHENGVGHGATGQGEVVAVGAGDPLPQPLAGQVQHGRRQVEPHDRVAQPGQRQGDGGGADTDLGRGARAQVGRDLAGQAAAPFEPTAGLVVAVGDAVERRRAHGPGPYAAATTAPPGLPRQVVGCERSRERCGGRPRLV